MGTWLTLLALGALSATPLQVVVTDTRVLAGADASLGPLVAEELARNFPAQAFRVTTSAQLSAVLGMERQKQLLGCGESSASCAAELANALGTEVIVQSTVAKVGTGMQCDVTLILGRDGSTLDRFNAQAPDAQALLDRLKEAAQPRVASVYARLRPGNTLTPGQPGVRRYAWVPAAGGLALLAGSGVLFFVTEGTWATLNSRSNRVTDPQGLARSGRTSETAAWVLGSVGAAALLASAAMFAFGAPTEPKVMLAPVAGPGGAGVFFLLRFQ